MTTAPETIGLVAGSGDFPIQFVQNAVDQGYKVVVIAHFGETNPKIEELNCQVFWIKLGQLGKVIKIIKKNKISRLAFAGGISRPNIFKGNIWLDFRGIALLAKTKSVKDDVILRAILKR